jgi:hypothetical protein
MNPVQQTVSGIVGPEIAVQLMNTDVDVNASPTNPEEIREEMWVRATKVGSVLENILHEKHGQVRWGINE